MPNQRSTNSGGPCADFRRSNWTRRHLLRAGTCASLAWPLGLLSRGSVAPARAGEQPAGAQPPVRARHVILLHQWGGPSQYETFDMKPAAPAEIRGKWQPIASAVPGLEVCELLPQMARVMDRCTLVRGVYHTMRNHSPAGYYSLTGHRPPLDDQRLRESPDLFPAYGSVVDRFAPAAEGIPTFVAYPHVIRDGAVTPGQGASFLGKKHDPLFIAEDPNSPSFALPELSLPASLSAERLQSRLALQRVIDRQAALLEFSATAQGVAAAQQRAVSMLTSPNVRAAFDLAAEPDDVRERYGRTTYGQGCLLARRLVESGVRFVNVYFSQSIGGATGGWDTHEKNFPTIEKFHLPITDQTLPTLLLDLEERGLLDTTLVVWMGEFGRTPKINDKAGRDHWPQCYTVLLAGGGVKRGYVHGASDKLGVHPARDAVRPDDLAATIFYLLGIDPASEVYDPLARPLPIAAGRPIVDLIG